MSVSYFTRFRERRPFVVVCGPSSSGKTILTDELVRLDASIQLRRPISYTTREKRGGEGNEYVFITRSEFDALWLTGRLINNDVVFGQHYGIDRESLSKITRYGYVPIKEVHASNVSKIVDAGYTPFVLMVSKSEALGTTTMRIDRVDDSLDGYYGLEQYYNYHVKRTIDAIQDAWDVIAWLEGTAAFLGDGEFQLSDVVRADKRNRIGYDAVAPEFADGRRLTTNFFHCLSEGFWRTRVAAISPKAVCLEIAPGRGWIRANFTWPNELPYRGVDISPVMRQLNPEADRIDLHSAHDLPYDREAFDVVIGSLLDPCLDPPMLAEVHRVLRPGGAFIGTIPSREWSHRLRSSTEKHQTTFILEHGGVAEVQSFCYSQRGLTRLLSAVGFSDIRVQELSVSPDASPEVPPLIRNAFYQDIGDQNALGIVLCWTCNRAH